MTRVYDSDGNYLKFEVDKKEEMSGVLQVRWGKPKDELHKIIRSMRIVSSEPLLTGFTVNFFSSFSPFIIWPIKKIK